MHWKSPAFGPCAKCTLGSGERGSSEDDPGCGLASEAIRVPSLTAPKDGEIVRKFPRCLSIKGRRHEPSYLSPHCHRFSYWKPALHTSAYAAVLYSHQKCREALEAHFEITIEVESYQRRMNNLRPRYQDGLLPAPPKTSHPRTKIERWRWVAKDGVCRRRIEIHIMFKVWSSNAFKIGSLPRFQTVNPRTAIVSIGRLPSKQTRGSPGPATIDCGDDKGTTYNELSPLKTRNTKDRPRFWDINHPHHAPGALTIQVAHTLVAVPQVTDFQRHRIMSPPSRAAKAWERKSTSTTKVVSTEVLCSSPHALAIGNGVENALRSPPPLPRQVPTNLLSFQDIGMSPPPSPLPHVVNSTKEILGCSKPELSPRVLRSVRSLSNVCHTNATELDLQAQSSDNQTPKFAFNLMTVPKDKRMGKGQPEQRDQTKLAPPPLERRRRMECSEKTVSDKV